MKKILIVEDEQNIAEMVRMFLTKNGFSCQIANNGTMAADMVENEIYDLALLDVMLPGIDGFELIGYIKQFGIPVIFVTAKTSVDDRVKGLKLGADDYILKPYDLKELLARIETVLKRYHVADDIIRFNNLIVNVPGHVVTMDGKTVPLSSKEFDLLLYFISNKNISLTRESIYEHVWKEPYYGNTRTVDLHVQRPKKKLKLEETIHGIYKIGYIFRTE